MTDGYDPSWWVLMVKGHKTKASERSRVGVSCFFFSIVCILLSVSWTSGKEKSFNSPGEDGPGLGPALSFDGSLGRSICSDVRRFFFSSVLTSAATIGTPNRRIVGVVGG